MGTVNFRRYLTSNPVSEYCEKAMILTFYQKGMKRRQSRLYCTSSVNASDSV